MDILHSLPLILVTAFIASASPGPATLAIAATAMGAGRGPGLRLAAGVLTGSLIWSVIAAAGLAVLMLSHGWAVEAIRYLGAAYLFWLAFKAGRAACNGRATDGVTVDARPYLRGLLLHLTNPKAIFFFGALYAVMLTPGQSMISLAIVVAAVGLQSAVVFLRYAVLFSYPGPMAVYRRCARWINGLSAVVFAGFGAKLLTARLT
jgi:threonine/homoserine/homoserine lactone efflux protein